MRLLTPRSLSEELFRLIELLGRTLEWTHNWASTRNLVHEVNTDRDVYEANDWFWTDLPPPDHNEDDNEIEEWQQGHEEKEIGWDNPAQQIPGTGKWRVYTGFNSGNDGNAWFESESELTMPDPFTGLDPWWPEQFDLLGHMNIQGAN